MLQQIKLSWRLVIWHFELIMARCKWFTLKFILTAGDMIFWFYYTTMEILNNWFYLDDCARWYIEFIMMWCKWFSIEFIPRIWRYDNLNSLWRDVIEYKCAYSDEYYDDNSKTIQRCRNNDIRIDLSHRKYWWYYEFSWYISTMNYHIDNSEDILGN